MAERLPKCSSVNCQSTNSMLPNANCHLPKCQRFAPVAWFTLFCPRIKLSPSPKNSFLEGTRSANHATEAARLRGQWLWPVGACGTEKRKKNCLFYGPVVSGMCIHRRPAVVASWHGFWIRVDVNVMFELRILFFRINYDVNL